MIFRKNSFPICTHFGIIFFFASIVGCLINKTPAIDEEKKSLDTIFFNLNSKNIRRDSFQVSLNRVETEVILSDTFPSWFEYHKNLNIGSIYFQIAHIDSTKKFDINNYSLFITNNNSLNYEIKIPGPQSILLENFKPGEKYQWQMHLNPRRENYLIKSGSFYTPSVPTFYSWTNSHLDFSSQKIIIWNGNKYSSTLLANQPTLVKDKDDNLYTNTYSLEGFEIGNVSVSKDMGKTWAILGNSFDTRFAPPKGYIAIMRTIDGIGISKKGTLLIHYTLQYNDGKKYDGYGDPTFHSDHYVIRSTDDGVTWSDPKKINISFFENVSADRTRFVQLNNGDIVLALPSWYQSNTNVPIPPSHRIDRTFIWTSSDDGISWVKSDNPICYHGSEPDFVELNSGRLLVSLRYQRVKLPIDDVGLISPITGDSKLGDNVIRNTAIIWSDDAGKSWTSPKLITDFNDQTGSLIQLSDETVVLVFGTKKTGLGQRFIVSYDEGETWSNNVFKLNDGGMYASSVVLATDTIITIHDRKPELHLEAIRWAIPPKSVVSSGGFFRPKNVEPLSPN